MKKPLGVLLVWVGLSTAFVAEPGTPNTLNVAAQTDGVDTTNDIERSLAAQLAPCNGIFIDAGANVGMHARFLFEPRFYNTSTFLPVFDEFFGPAPARERVGGVSRLCAIAFEPNPAHRQRFERLSEAYNQAGMRLVYAPYGVSDARGNLTFYHNTGHTAQELAFSTSRQSADAEEVVIDTIDLARMLTLLTAQRRRVVVMKMDIEGSEFMVLPHLIAHGAFCNMLDHASVEFHERYAPFHFTGHQMASSLATEAGALTTKTVLTSMVRDSGDGCRTRRIDERDDERYRADRSPEQLEHPSVVA